MRQASAGWQHCRRQQAHPYNTHMGIDAATIHVSRDQNHLVWDPAIPAVATLAAGRTVDFVSDTTSAVTTPIATGIH